MWSFMSAASAPQLEGEEMQVHYEGFSGGDRTRIELPPVQEDLLKALQATGKPVVFVNCSGSAMAMPWEADQPAGHPCRPGIRASRADAPWRKCFSAT